MSKNLILIFVGAIIIFLGGYFAGKSSVPTVDINLVKQEAKQNLLDSLRQRLNSKTGKGLLPMFARYRETDREREETGFASLTGKMSAVDAENNILEVKVANWYKGGDFFDYLNEPDYYIKTVKIGNNTKIVKQKGKDRGKYIKEMEEYKKSGEKGSAPEPYIETPLLLEDLEKGQEVIIETELEFKLEENKVLQAKKIVTTE